MLSKHTLAIKISFLLLLNYSTILGNAYSFNNDYISDVLFCIGITRILIDDRRSYVRLHSYDMQCVSLFLVPQILPKVNSKRIINIKINL